jgi:hypothetical protein
MIKELGLPIGSCSLLFEDVHVQLKTGASIGALTRIEPYSDDLGVMEGRP